MQSGCCGPFFGPAGESSKPFTEEIGRKDEIIIVVSCPGDKHPWKTSDGTRSGSDVEGRVHTTFEDYAKRSGGRVLFCPVQMGIRKDNVLVPPEQLETDEQKRDFYVNTADADPEFKTKGEELDLWKAYWMSKVRWRRVLYALLLESVNPVDR